MYSLFRSSGYLRFGVRLGLLMGVLACSPSVFAQQPGSTEAPVLSSTQPVIQSKAVADFCRRFHRAKTLSFTAYLSYYWSDFGLMTMNTFTVVAQRPIQFAIRGGPTFRYEPEKNGIRHPTFLGLGHYNINICDGKTLLQMNPIDHTYETKPAPLTMDQIHPSAFHLIMGSIVLSSDLLSGYQAAPDEHTNKYTKPVSVFVQTDNTSNAGYFLTNKLSFDQDTGELLSYSQYTRDRKTGEEVEQQRIEYDNWKLNMKMNRSLFDTTPPRNARTLEEFLRAIKADPP